MPTGDPLTDFLGQFVASQGLAGGGGGGLSFEQAAQGIGPLQREAGTAARQFVASGGGRFDVSPQLQAQEEIQRRRLTESSADLREGFSIAGGRIGTPAAVGEARLREGLESQFTAQTGELLRQEFSNQMNRMLQGIALLQNIGTSNLEPFFRFASMGIMPEQVGFEQHPAVTGLQTVAGLGTAAANLIPVLSDVRFKSDVEPIRERVKRLRGVSFTWNSDGKPSIGLVAQELEKEFPELVQTYDGVKYVNYAGLTAILLELVNVHAN